jgi:transketolase C-terminal domain/subunit
VQLRLSRWGTGDFLPPDADFQLGKAQTLRSGEDVVLAACGPLLRNVLLENGLGAGVVDFHTLKPFDGAAARRCTSMGWIPRASRSPCCRLLPASVFRAVPRQEGKK